MHEELCYFAHCLRARPGLQADFFGGALDGLAQCAPTIRRWGRTGQDTFGLDLLADQWRLSKQTLLPLASRTSTGDPLSEFRGTADSQYLHLLLHCRLLDGPQALAQLTLRSWAVLKAHEFAAKNILCEGYLQRLCTNLRIATYEPIPDWGPVLSALVVKDQAFDMVAADLQAEVAAVEGRMPSGSTLQLKHRAFLASMKAFGAGGCLDPEESVETRVKTSPVPVPRRNQEDPAAGFTVEAAAESALYIGTAQDEEADSQIASVDPDATPRQQEHEARSIYLSTAVDASLVRWRWNTPSPHESTALRGAIRSALDDQSSQPEHRLLAALVWIALNAGRTLEEAGRMAVDPKATRFSQWELDLHLGVILRKSPRREAHWRPRDDTARLVHPSVDDLIWNIPPSVLKVLRTAAISAGRPQHLHDVWRAASSVPIEQAFLKWMQGYHLTARLRSGMLANSLRQDIFERTGDHLLSRLLGSRDRDGLPAAAAYGTYLSDALPKATDLVASTAPQVEVNVAGSLLAPSSDHVLRDGFRRAHAEIERLQSQGTWIEFHNATALYWDALLRAATGIRPSNTLWTDQRAIDWSHAFVFIDEKVSPLIRSGRLVPIPAELLWSFKRSYVEKQLPFALDAIERHGLLFDPNVAGNLLFLIDDQVLGRGMCGPITQKDRERIGIERPFPLNVFRHRLRTGLQRLEADPEVIDSVLGHSDGSSPAHGRYSMRTWSDDMEKLRPVLKQLLTALGVEVPPILKAVSVAANSPSPRVGSRSPARPASRLKTARAAIADSRQKISNFLIEKLPLDGTDAASLDQGQILDGLVRLTDVQVEQLESLLTQTDKGMPSTIGSLRHAYLVKLARKAWDVLEKPVRLRRRQRPAEPEPSAYTQDAPGALERLSQLREVLDQLFKERPHPSHLSVSDAHVLVTMDLIANSRIAAARVLAAPRDSRVNCRLALLGQGHYLEWSPDASLQERPDAPIQRFRITSRAARLLEGLLNKTVRLDVDAHASSVLSVLRAALDLGDDVGYEGVKERAAALVGQCNVIELPGAVAGYLNGSLMTAALCQADFVRFRRQVFVGAPQATATATATQESNNESPPALSPQTAVERRAGAAVAEGAARQLFKEVRDELVRLRTPEASRHRQQSLHALRQSVSANRTVSSTIRLLCLWAIDRLQKENQERPLGAHATPAKPAKADAVPKKKRRATIETTSALRYLSALKPVFLDLASDVDMISLEAEELADFYQVVLSEARVQNLNYLYRRLRDFHRFCMRYGAPPVDWSEIVPADAPDLGAPGFIDEAAYQLVLEALASTQPPAGVQSWQLLVFAIMCYRFGLRGGEVMHLRRGDLSKLPDGLRLVLVRPRRFHKLKSAAARRQVPLVFPLSQREEDALKQLEVHHEVSALGTANPPLLGATDDPQREVADAIVRQHLNNVIQAVTGQASLSLHDMRHSLACRIWQALESPLMPAGASDNCLGPSGLAHLRETLLGPHSPANTRRSAWALATLLGHVGPSTSMRSYVHFVTEAAEAAVGARVGSVPTWSNAWRQASGDLFEVLARAPGASPVALDRTAQVLKPALALDALVLFSQGKSAVETAAALRVSVKVTDRLLKLSLAIDAKLGSRPNRAVKSARVTTNGLLSRVPPSCFQRLRVGLAEFNMDDRSREIAPGLADVHIVGMVGPDRQVNMWTRAQMVRVAQLIRGAGVGRSRLGVACSSKIPAGLLLPMAMEAGWLPAASSGSMHENETALCTRLFAKTLPASAKFGPLDIAVTNRLVFELVAACDGWIHDRVEFWISFVCVQSCTDETPNSLLFDSDF